jgi:fatty-acyl-CoA synthase
MLTGPDSLKARFQDVNAALRAAGAEPESGIIFVDVDESETQLLWSELYGRARAAAGVLRRFGVHRGDRVALVLPTSFGFMDAFFGSLLAGAVPVPLPPPVRLGNFSEYKKSIARMLDVTGPRVVLSEPRLLPMLRKMNELCSSMFEFHSVHSLQELKEGEVVERIEPDDTALILFSSGATTEPKAVALSHRQLMAQCAALISVMPARGRQIGVSWLPLHHDMGLIGSLLTAVCYGQANTVFLTPGHFLTTPAAWLRAISRHRGVISPSPNFGYAHALKSVRDDEMAGADLSCWTYALNGADTISMSVMQEFADRFSRWGFRREALTPVYGLAEASLAVTFSDTSQPPHSVKLGPPALAQTDQFINAGTELVSVGSPIPGVSVAIRDEFGTSLSEGQIGRIFVHGPSVMSGYFADPEATRKVLRDGWLDTGDLGFVLAGELYFAGRAKEIVVIRGANFGCVAIEACLAGIEETSTGCVIAGGFTPEGGTGEELVILAERAHGADPTHDRSLAEQIRAAVNERFAVRPHCVCVLEPCALPRTSSGKLRRGEALRRFVSGAYKRPAVHKTADVVDLYRRHRSIALARLAELMHAGVESRSEGAYVWDESGKRYLNCGGYGVFILGHCHPRVVSAVSQQVRTHPISTNLLLNRAEAEAAATLARVSPPGLDQIYFASSGAEAVETALKLARWNGKRRVIAMRNGFHGMTLGSLSVTGRDEYRSPFEPLLTEVQFVPFGDIGALESALRDGPAACVLLEPVQAEGGVIIPPEGYLTAVVGACRIHGAVLIADEIQTGLGRLGVWWGVDREGVVPDLLLAGKALGGGVVPVSAVIGSQSMFNRLSREPLVHSSTFSGAPIAMAAAQATIETLEAENIIDRAAQLGARLHDAVMSTMTPGGSSLVSEIRAVGLLIGVEWRTDYMALDFMIEMLDRGVILSHSMNAPRVTRLTPPAILTDSDVTVLQTALAGSMEAMVKR